MRKEQPFISIITLNYNQTDVTCDFLASTRHLKYRNFEILVCDMDSTIDPTEQINAGNYPNTRLLLAKANLGFAGGNNWGMRQAKGDFMFIVNNDTEVTDNLLDELLKPFYQDETIGVTCPKIKYFDQPNTIQYAGFNPMNNFTGRTTGVGVQEEDKGQHDVPGTTFGAHGCAMLVKKEVIDKVGMFPEKFFLYYEEWDWSARILKAGFKIWYTPQAVIYHKESLSVGKANPMKVYYHTRNRILYIRRNAGILPLLVFTAYFSLFALPKNSLGYVARRQFKHLKNLWKGAAWNLYSSSHSAV
ncbi:glycosyltransferase family 2 protein [Paraflavitalea pollutisoli]|uniref:glycosyltransferase family 2 protein n=1 Tax=Paraflavitalea pollutisoli TaxID=3034143 RepID=UPI0023ECD8BE|nr:glycosyltransferase family 2 protein [Paraflavitalea sp. H1-2-19X]